MQFPKVEECDFDRQFLFDEYMAISHRYELNCLATFMMHDSLLNFHRVFLDTL
jgi:hypothetical protein